MMVDVPSHPSDPVEMRRLNFQTPGKILQIVGILGKKRFIRLMGFTNGLLF